MGRWSQEQGNNAYFNRGTFAPYTLSIWPKLRFLCIVLKLRICEQGDSALAFAVAGRSVWGAEKVGCFPLRGKLINTREASVDAIAKNEARATLKCPRSFARSIRLLGGKPTQELKNVNTILGLRAGEDAVDKLRYGSVIILSDSDAVRAFACSPRSP